MTTEPAPDAYEPATWWSKPAGQRGDGPLVALLHGYGSNEEDLPQLVGGLPPEFTYVSPRAPIPLADQGHGPDAYSWFPVRPGPDGLPEYAGEESEVLDQARRVGQWLLDQAPDGRKVALVGFSMGMILGSTLVRLFPGRFAAMAGLSGFVIDRPMPGDDELARAAAAGEGFPFFWGRDQEDPVIESRHIAPTTAWLSGHTRLTKVLYTGMGHSISPAEVNHVGQFLRHILR